MISTRALARPTVTAAALTCVATLALAGCSQPTTASDGRPASATTSAAPATPETTDPVSPKTPVETTTSTAPEPSEPATTDVGDTGDLRARLLSAAEVPGFNEEFGWKAGATRTTEPEPPFGTCQRFPLGSIGATSVAHRAFLPVGPAPSDDQAGELVAEFPDSTTARRAFAVLKSWRARCADRLEGREQVKVRALQDVPVDAGTAGWYLATYGPVPKDPDALYFDAQGMTVVGSRIAMVEMVLVGQDYNYEPGQEPIVAALQHAAAKLS